MFILPCFCWSKCCYHRNRRSSRTSHWELGATSLICRSARPAASQELQVEISTAAGTDLGLLALQLGKTRLRDPPYRTAHSTLCLAAEKSTKMLWGWCRSCKSSQLFQWSLCQRHIQSSSSSFFILVADGFKCQLCMNLLQPFLLLSHPHLMSEGCFCFSIFPLPRPIVTETSITGNILQPSKEDELLQLCLALYWSAALLALFHESTLLSMQADTCIFQCWVQLPHLLTLPMETKRPICWEKHSGIIL